MIAFDVVAVGAVGIGVGSDGFAFVFYVASSGSIFYLIISGVQGYFESAFVVGYCCWNFLDSKYLWIGYNGACGAMGDVPVDRTPCNYIYLVLVAVNYVVMIVNKDDEVTE
eukprot:265628_1